MKEKNPTIINNSFDDSIKDFDYSLAPLIMNFDNDIKYLKVLSQEDYNEIEPDNDTIYFINNIHENVNSIKNILDVAVSHTKRDSNEPEYIWALTVDEEMEQVSLWRAPFKKSGHYTLVKVYQDFKDGRLTFDGIYEYNEDYTQATLITNNEPFLVLIRSNGQLRAFPNLNTKDLNDGELGRQIDGNENNPVITCSVEKGYCSELFKEYDQGIVIAYSIFTSGHYELRYRQFRYVNPSDSVRQLAGIVNICNKSEKIFNIAVRRLNDYRLGITYNYWVEENNEKISYTEFRYSKRLYVGLAYHPENIKIKGLPEIGQILYGAVRNDNIIGPEQPFLSLTEDLNTVKVKDPKSLNASLTIDATELIFGLTADDDPENPNPIKIELINIDKNSTEFTVDEEVDYSKMLGFVIQSSWLDDYKFGNDVLKNDPDYKTNAAFAPEILKIRTEGDKLIVTIRGDGMPLTPFKIIPTASVADVINLRYNVEPFNIEGQGKNLAGWFALTNFRSSELGEVRYRNCGVESATLRDYSKKLCNSMQFTTTYGSYRKGKTSFNFGIKTDGGNGSGVTMAPEIERIDYGNNIRVEISSGYGSGVVRRVSSINV